jgi:hypothetical protein
MARLYADGNFRVEVVVALRSLGHDVLTIQDAGQGNQAISDEAVLDCAARIHDVIAANEPLRGKLIRVHRP